MVYQKRYIYWTLLLFVLLTAFSGCATKRPITTKIIDDVAMAGGNKIPNIPEDFQCYLSKKVTLRLFSTPEPESSVGREGYSRGKLILLSQTTRSRITLSRNLPGVVQSHEEKITYDNGYELRVGFEKEPYRSLFIRFGQSHPGDEKYYLLYDDNQNSTIKYGNGNYTVHFDENADPAGYPYLVIKEIKRKINESSARRASGLKLGE
jgi:hypothetical protein